MAEVTCKGLTRRFAETTALAGVSCRAAHGEVLLVLGPSGAGKTTLLECVAGLERCDEGVVEIGGRTVAAEGVNVPPHERGCAMVFQRPTLWPHMRALDNVALALAGRKLHRRERRRLAARALGSVGLDDRICAWPATLSGGELQRVGLARAIVLEPEILIYDEPTTGLDPIATVNVDNMISETAKSLGVTSIVISHDMASTFRIADRIFMLQGGRIIAAGSPDEIIDSRNDDLRIFVETSGTVKFADRAGGAA